jgi:dephospho-CoA kinase
MSWIGLTGGIGSGKSTVAGLLAELGAVVIDADQVARVVVEPGTPGLAQVQAAFGTEVITGAGELNRQALAAIVFASPQARQRLEAITHPLIAARTRELRVAAGPAAIVVHDVPLLVERDLAANYDLVVVVQAPLNVRLDRLRVHRGLTEAQVRQRVAAQATDEQRAAVADMVISTDQSLTKLKAKVKALWHSIIGLPPGASR